MYVGRLTRTVKVTLSDVRRPSSCQGHLYDRDSVKFSANNFSLDKSFEIIILNMRPTRVKHATEIFMWMLSRSRNAVFLGMDMV